jgi:hypothetical protein
MTQDPATEFNNAHLSDTLTAVEKELEVYKDKEHTRWQLKEVCIELAILLARIGVVYWIFTLAMLGTRGVDSYEIRVLSQGTLVACSMLWLVTEVFFLKPYYPIRDDACDGWEILASKAKCAIKAWKECKAGEKE